MMSARTIGDREPQRLRLVESHRASERAGEFGARRAGSGTEAITKAGSGTEAITEAGSGTEAITEASSGTEAITKAGSGIEARKAGTGIEWQPPKRKTMKTKC